MIKNLLQYGMAILLLFVIPMLMLDVPFVTFISFESSLAVIIAPIVVAFTIYTPRTIGYALFKSFDVVPLGTGTTTTTESPFDATLTCRVLETLLILSWSAAGIVMLIGGVAWIVHLGGESSAIGRTIQAMILGLFYALGVTFFIYGPRLARNRLLCVQSETRLVVRSDN